MDECVSNKCMAKNKLYTKLPDDILENVRHIGRQSSTGYIDIRSHLLNILPISDSREIDQNLKTLINTTPKTRKSISKKVIPKPRKTKLSQMEIRSLGLNDIPKNGVKYYEALEINRMWKKYITSNVNVISLQNKRLQDNSGIIPVSESLNMSLLKADYHGALVIITASKCPSQVGISGIIIKDTKFAFSIVGKDNITRTIPKQPCVFEIVIDKYRFKIFGKYFCIRSSERSTKKLKTNFTPAL